MTGGCGPRISRMGTDGFADLGKGGGYGDRCVWGRFGWGVCERENHEFREWARMIFRTGAFGVSWRGAVLQGDRPLRGWEWEGYGGKGMTATSRE